MSRAYKFNDADGVYFISFATVGWLDVFTRREYYQIHLLQPFQPFGIYQAFHLRNGNLIEL